MMSRAASCLAVVSLLLLGVSTTHAQDVGEGCCNVVDCLMGDWGEWGTCSALCGGTGTRNRTREPILTPVNGGLPCNETLIEWGHCNFDPCIDPKVGCEAQPMDIMFLVQSTFSDPRAYLREVFVALKQDDIAHSATKYNESTRIGLALFGQANRGAWYNDNDADDADTSFGSTFAEIYEELEGNWDPASDVSDGTMPATGPAINWALNELRFHDWARSSEAILGNGHRPDRPGARKVLVVMAETASEYDAVPACHDSLHTDVEIYTVYAPSGWGGYSEPEHTLDVWNELKQIADKPIQQYYTQLPADWFSAPVGSETTALVQSLLQAPGSSCDVYGRGHINTFDGNSYHFPSPGEYYLINECPNPKVDQFFFDHDLDGTPLGSFVVQARVVPCDCRSTESSGITVTIPVNGTAEDGITSYDPVSSDLCIRGYVVSDGSDSLEIVHDAALGMLFVRHNAGDLETDFSPPTAVGQIEYTVTHRQDTGYWVDIEFADDMHAVHLSFSERSSTASLIPAISKRGVSNGLCGKFDGCPLNDFTSRDSTIVPLDADADTLYNDFGSSWAVAREESLFWLEGRQSYSPAKGHGRMEILDKDNLLKMANAEEAMICEGLPDGALRVSCLFDLMATSETSSAFDQIEIFKTHCGYYCETGKFLSSASFANPATGVYMQPVCDRVCRYWWPLDLEELYALPSLHMPGWVDISLSADGDDNAGYDEILGALPDLILLGSDLPSSSFLFSGATNFGGQYTFQQTVRRHDVCSGVHPQHTEVLVKNVTVSIACLELPEAEIISDDDGTDNTFVMFGRSTTGFPAWPTVQLMAWVDTPFFEPAMYEFQPRLRYSWKVVSFKPWDLVLIKEGNAEGELTKEEIDDLTIYDGLPGFEDPNSVYPTFTPDEDLGAGEYIIEFAITDECSVARYRTKVTAVQRCCVPQVNVAAVGEHMYWGGYNDDLDSGFSDWGSVPLNLVGSSIDEDNVLGDLPFASENAADLIFDWVLLGRSRTSPGSARIPPPEHIGDVAGVRTYLLTDVVRPQKIVRTAGFLSLDVNTTDTDVDVMLDDDEMIERLSEEYYAETFLGEATIFETTKVDMLVYEHEWRVEVQPEINIQCTINIYGYDTPSPLFEIVTNDIYEPGQENLYTSGKHCQGYWHVQARTHVEGYAEKCTKTEEVLIQATCGAGPVADFRCSHLVTYDYADRTFPDVELDASFGSFDTGDADEGRMDLQYRWLWTDDNTVIEGCEPDDFGEGETCIYDGDDIEAGEYLVSLEVSNGCQTARTSESFKARCLESVYVDEPEKMILKRTTRDVITGNINVTQGGSWKVYHNGQLVEEKEDQDDTSFTIGDGKWGDTIGFEVSVPEQIAGATGADRSAFIVGYLGHRGKNLWSRATWRCSDENMAGWARPDFDVSDWVFATPIYTNADPELGLPFNAQINAKWIWTENQEPLDPPLDYSNTIYCRTHIEWPTLVSDGSTGRESSAETVLNTTSVWSPILDLEEGWIDVDWKEIGLTRPELKEWEEDLYIDFFGSNELYFLSDDAFDIYDWEDTWQHVEAEFNYPGTYKFQLDVSDGCTEKTYVQEVVFSCHNVGDTSNPPIDPVPPIPTRAIITMVTDADRLEWDPDEEEFQIIEFQSDSTTDTSLFLDYDWKVEEEPEPGALLLTDSASDTSSWGDFEGEFVHVLPLMPGDYVIRLTVFDGCRFSTVLHSFTVGCPMVLTTPGIALDFVVPRALLNADDGVRIDDVVYVLATHDSLEEVVWSELVITYYDEDGNEVSSMNTNDDLPISETEYDFEDDERTLPDSDELLPWEDNEYPFVFTPYELGEYALEFTVCDVCGQCAVYTRTISVMCSNHVDVLTDTPVFTASASEDQSVAFRRSGFPCVHLHGESSILGLDNTDDDFSYEWLVTSVVPAVAGQVSAYNPQAEWTVDEYTEDAAIPVEVLTYFIPSTSATAGGEIANITTVMRQDVYRSQVLTTYKVQLTNLYTADDIHNDVDAWNAFPVSFHPDVAGVYEVELRITDNDCGLVSTATTTVTASCGPQPVAKIVAPTELRLGAEEMVVLHLDASTSGVDTGAWKSFTWTYRAGTNLDVVPEILNADTAWASVEISVADTYQFTLVVNDGCQNSAKVYHTVTVSRDCTIIAPAIEKRTTHAAFNYLNPLLTETYCLKMPNIEAMSSAAMTTLASDADDVEDFYEDYGGLQCDPVYEWKLKAYNPAHETLESFNPCEEDGHLAVCAIFKANEEAHNDRGKMRDAPTPPPVVAEEEKKEPANFNKADEKTPTTEQGWFVVLMVLLAIGIVVGTVLMLKKKGGKDPGYQAAES